MIIEKEIKRFSNRISNYNNFTSEKEIETEFYNFIKQYYTNKYTDIGEGKLSYTAPYNIDGLLEIRTLDTDYRILVEAKSNKNYSNKKVRNEVLSQAIYYCRKLNYYGELIPAAIILLEASSMVVINSENIEFLINEPFVDSAASEAYKTDEILIDKLNNYNYIYKLINFKKDVDYNLIFDDVDKMCNESYFNNSKKDLSINSFSLILNFIDKFKIFKNKNNYYYYINNNYSKIPIGSLKILMFNTVNLRNIGIDKGFKYLESLTSEIEITHIRIGDLIINLNTKEIENAPYVLRFTDVNYQKTNGCYDYKILAEYLFNEKYKNEHLLIKTNVNNYKYFEKLFNIFNVTFEYDKPSNYVYNGPGIIIFNNTKNLKVNSNIIKNNKIIDLSDTVNYEELVSEIVNSYNNFSYDKSNFERMIVDEWNENNDVMASWIKSKLEKGAGVDFITLEDCYLSFVELLLERGHPKCTLRHFVDLFTNHSLFFEWNLKYMKNSYYAKDYKRSNYNSNDLTYTPKPIKLTGNFILGVKFK